MHGLTPEFVLGYRAMMLDGIQREAEITKRVMAAVPDAASTYKPDPQARSAREIVLAHREYRCSVSGWNRRSEFQDGKS